MTIGIGGSTAEIELSKLTDMTGDISPISVAEYQQRIAKAQQLMREQNISALYLNAGTNLTYFTGTAWYASERLVGAILPAEGELVYIAPWFEVSTLSGFMQIKSEVASWHEHESPYELVIDVLKKNNCAQGTISIDEATAFFAVDGMINAAKAQNLDLSFTSSKSITAECRMIKSASEIALLQRAKDMTMVVHRAVAKILTVGTTTAQVTNFINQAHIKLGAPKGSSFCIVLFGQDTAYPHGVKEPKTLEFDDMVLIDTGCLVQGYNSDITRSYVFGEASEKQRAVWLHERTAQVQGFEAAKITSPCESVDIAARGYLETQGYGPDYQVPGLPHRTGHGVGLDIHEWPYLVRGDKTPLAAGMCFSNEPMLCLYGEFGVRLEDHFYMTEAGPKWFSEPAHSIDNPFGYEE
ncbi:M24 family metallopeptidase [Colwellia psychrerythraea]|uniref:Peptidase M24 n=1 Tax=Colwellia psychrerythraea TaxID=28229 RepID=A0A099L287_COLPS|nr:Xaa-Pro peptidase family protein [Colwellia psychrerythraea]KGJ96971.1 peptidase M24 [Colwellia psychrerythraea]